MQRLWTICIALAMAVGSHPAAAQDFDPPVEPQPQSQPGDPKDDLAGVEKVLKFGSAHERSELVKRFADAETGGRDKVWALPVLLDQVRQPDADGRLPDGALTAMQLITLIGPPAAEQAMPVLRRLVEYPSESPMPWVGGMDRGFVPARALATMAALGPDGCREAIVGVESIPGRAAAVEVLEAIVVAPQEWLEQPLARAALFSSQSFVRRKALWLMVRIVLPKAAPPDHETMSTFLARADESELAPLLLPALIADGMIDRHPGFMVRLLLDCATLPELESRLFDVETNLRAQARHILEAGDTAWPAPEQRVIVDRLADNDPEIRALAARVLGHLSEAGVASLVQLLSHDPSWAVRQAALQSLLEIGPAAAERTVVLLPPLIGDPAEPLRLAAAMALVRLAPADEVLAILLPLLGATDDLKGRAMAVRIIAQHVGEAAVPALIRMLQRDKPDAVSDATTALAFIGKPAVGALRELLKADKPAHQVAAINALGQMRRMGADAGEAIPDLQRLSKSADNAVARAADRALAAIE